MSRIEKAMERAAQLRKGVAPITAPDPILREAQPVHIPPPLKCVEERITAENPLLVTLNDPLSPAAEEFRKLKSTLVNLTKEGNFKNTLLVTSAVPNEGKSITALNLAISLAQEINSTVLLVDADMRRPSIHRYLDIPNGQGVSDCLRGSVEVGQVILATGIGRLSVITAGSDVKNPVELVTSQKMQEFIEELKLRYVDRYVIIDAPPVLPFAETRTLGRLVDGVLFVIKERLASQRNIHDALDALSGCELIGAVYNDTAIDLHDEHYSYYRSYATDRQ